MVFEKLHDSSYPNTEHLDGLYKDVEACYENFKKVMDDYQKGIGVTPSDVYYYEICKKRIKNNLRKLRFGF